MTTEIVAFQSAEVEDMIRAASAASDGYAAEVIKSERLSVGLYRLDAGALDDQTPHGEDEVYYAVQGRARLSVAGKDHAVKPGSVLFVPARVEHRFHDITEELILVVFWAPPEGSVR